MYGSTFRMRVKSGQEQAVIDLFEEWEAKCRAQASGSIGGLLMKSDPPESLQVYSVEESL